MLVLLNENDGKIYISSHNESKELSLILDEDIDNIEVTIMLLKSFNIITGLMYEFDK